MFEIVRLKAAAILFQVRRGSRARGRRAARITLFALVAWLVIAPEPAPRRARLAASLGPFRCVEGRLTGGFLHAPFDTAGRGKWTPRQRKALNRFKKEVEPGRAAGDPGLVRLLAGNTAAALAVWQEAYGEAWLDAGLTSDLAAAYLAMASGKLIEIARALAMADRALQLAPGLPEARFNRALALEKLFLRDEARQAWRHYLELDQQTGWAHEARSRLRRLEQPTRAERWPAARVELERAALHGDAGAVRRIVEQFPQFAREHGEEKLLTRWAEHLAAGRRRQAQETLRILRSLGSALAEFKGEQMIADAVEAIDRALGDPDPGRLAALVEGHGLYSDTHDLILAHRADVARPRLQQMRVALARGRTPFRRWADLLAVLCAIDEGDAPTALQELAAIRSEARLRRYGSLEGRAAWIQGILDMRGADPTRALASYQLALHLFGQSGERGNCASVRGLFADTWRQLGEPHWAWSFRRAALAEMGEISHPRRLRPLANETAEALASQQRPDIALYFHDLGIWAARVQGDATALAQFLQRRALLRHRLGDRAGFAKDMADARRSADAITAPTRSRIQADLLSIQVEVEGPSAAGSLRRLDQAIAIYEQAGDRIPLARLYLARGRGWRAAGDLEKTESDFGAAVREYEIPRGRLANPLRTSYLDQAREAFEEMIALQLERGRPDLALQFSERGRARTLADRQVTSGGAATPLPAGDLPALLPPATVLIEISVLADRLVAWVIRSDGIGPALELPLRRQELETLVTLLYAEIAGNRPDPSAARRLFEEVVQPLQSRIQPGEALIFVPEESLLAVPFAALENPATGCFLVEDHAVGVAPSAAAYLHALRRSRLLAASAAPRPALFVGDPAFDPALFPGLPRLPHARAEAAALASRYPGATVLREDRARKDRILPGLGEYGVLHIASHALIHPELPLRSRFALAPGGGDSGSLTAGELGAVPLPHTRLAVLSACRTGGDERIGAEGASSLVWPFLAAGVPAVVASLWDVDDMSTAGLMSSFHERLQAGDDPWSALREAQLRSKAAGAPIAAWAAFQVYGGGDVRPASNAFP